MSGHFGAHDPMEVRDPQPGALISPDVNVLSALQCGEFGQSIRYMCTMHRGSYVSPIAQSVNRCYKRDICWSGTREATIGVPQFPI